MTPESQADDGYSDATARPLNHYCTALYQRLLLLRNGASHAPQSIGVTSCERGEGVSSIAANLAICAARLGAGEALLVDANSAHPSVAQSFHLDDGPGWGEILAGKACVAECVRPSSLTKLSILPAGNAVNGPGFIFDPARLVELLGELKRTYATIVFDLPVTHELSPCAALAAKLDGVLLVVEAERIRYDAARRAKQELEHVHARILGVVFNKRDLAAI